MANILKSIYSHYSEVDKNLKKEESKMPRKARGLPEPVESKGGQMQAGRVMKEFYAGKLRSKGEEKVTSPEQAKAIAMSEGRAAEARGTEKRTWKGRTRVRPILKK